MGIELIPDGPLVRTVKRYKFGTSTDATHTFTLAGLGDASGRYSDVCDLGSCRPWLLNISLSAEWAAAPAVGDYVHVKLIGRTAAAAATGVVVEGDLGDSDAAFSSSNDWNVLRHYVGGHYVQSTSTGTLVGFVQNGFYWYGRYFQVAVWNGAAGAGDDFSADVDNNFVLVDAVEFRG